MPSLSVLRGGPVGTPHLLRNSATRQWGAARGAGWERGKADPQQGREARRQPVLQQRGMVPASFCVSGSGSNWRSPEESETRRGQDKRLCCLPDSRWNPQQDRGTTNLEETGQGNEELYRQSTLPLKTLHPCLHLFLSKLPSSRPSSEGRVNVLLYFFFHPLAPMTRPGDGS